MLYLSCNIDAVNCFVVFTILTDIEQLEVAVHRFQLCEELWVRLCQLYEGRFIQDLAKHYFGRKGEWIRVRQNESQGSFPEYEGWVYGPF